MSCGSEECIKVIVVGNCGVGKTCLLHRFVCCSFIDLYTKTIGAEFLEKDVFSSESQIAVKLMLWDTAGQETSSALTQGYYYGAGAAVLVFSTVDHDSYTDVAKWKQKVEFVCGPIVMVLCQTKYDLFHESSVTDREAVGLAEEFQLPLFRVSSKDNFNVFQLFEFIVQQCLVVEEIDGSEKFSSQFKALDTESGCAVNRAKESEYRARKSHKDSLDSGLVLQKVTTAVPIITDGHTYRPASDFSDVKAQIPQKRQKSTKENQERMKLPSSSVSKKNRRCKCTLV
ncbi:unnamed protein product [Phytomonas sp. Hart1]|nr:unnamed protein product [Phytomonas sp. Hart1]|eukprot:CCW70040.1 unnamed protein product [Phytomonas sp. isolate Hart1]